MLELNSFNDNEILWLDNSAIMEVCVKEEKICLVDIGQSVPEVNELHQPTHTYWGYEIMVFKNWEVFLKYIDG